MLKKAAILLGFMLLALSALPAYAAQVRAVLIHPSDFVALNRSSEKLAAGALVAVEYKSLKTYRVLVLNGGVVGEEGMMPEDNLRFVAGSPADLPTPEQFFAHIPNTNLVNPVPAPPGPDPVPYRPLFEGLIIAALVSFWWVFTNIKKSPQV